MDFSVCSCKDGRFVIPARAGMYYINHWIPAFAGMTAKNEVKNPSFKLARTGRQDGLIQSFHKGSSPSALGITAVSAKDWAVNIR